MSDRQATHSADCYKWHHKCAISQVERLRDVAKTVTNHMTIEERRILDNEIEDLTDERDRLREESESWQARFDFLAKETQRAIRSYIDERDKLREELAAAQKDAERYRWLRDCVVPEGLKYDLWEAIQPEDWDESIDAAMAKEKRDE